MLVDFYGQKSVIWLYWITDLYDYNKGREHPQRTKNLDPQNVNMPHLFHVARYILIVYNR